MKNKYFEKSKKSESTFEKVMQLYAEYNPSKRISEILEKRHSIPFSKTGINSLVVNVKKKIKTKESRFSYSTASKFSNTDRFFKEGEYGAATNVKKGGFVCFWIYIENDFVRIKEVWLTKKHLSNIKRIIAEEYTLGRLGTNKVDGLIDLSVDRELLNINSQSPLMTKFYDYCLDRIKQKRGLRMDHSVSFMFEAMFRFNRLGKSSTEIYKELLELCESNPIKKRKASCHVKVKNRSIEFNKSYLYDNEGCGYDYD